jgi:tetratricopeptide (TPR) repeat protein
VVKICAKLDGLPLAIELAAARLAMLSLPMLQKRLERQLLLFVGSEKRSLTKQQTLQKTIEWSYTLLDPGEKALLHLLTVFKSGCTCEAIESVALATGMENVDLFTTLKSLVDKSFVVQQEGEQGEPRFRRLYIIHAYATAQRDCTAREERETVNRCHAAYYLALAEEIAPLLTGIEQKSSLARLEEEHENIQAALAWYIAAGQIEAGARLAEALGRFWWMHGHLTEGRKWLNALLASEQAESISPSLRIRILVLSSRMASSQNDYLAARQLADQALTASLVSADPQSTSTAYTAQAEVAFHRGDYDQATTFLEQSLSIQRSLQNKRGIASLLNNLGNVALQQEHFDRAASLQEQSLVLFRQFGDTSAISTVLISLGEIERRRGNYQRAVVLYEESLHLCRKLGYSEGIATSLVSLGDLARYRGDHIQATRLYQESLQLFRKLNDKVGITVCLDGLAEVAYLRDQLEQATRLFAQAEVTAYHIGTSIVQHEHNTHQNTISMLRSRLEDGLFDGLWIAGQALTLEQATSEALGEDDSSLLDK